MRRDIVFFLIAVAVSVTFAGLSNAEEAWNFTYPIGTEVEGADRVLIEDYSESGQKRVTTVEQIYDGQIKTAPITITYPVEGDTWIIGKAASTMAVQQVDCLSVGGTSVVLDVLVCDSDGSSCAALVADAAITCDDDGASDGGNMLGAGISEDAWIKTSVGEVTGDVAQVSLTVRYK